MNQHRQLAVEARGPRCQPGGFERGCLQLGHRVHRGCHVTRGQQRLAPRDQEFGGLVGAVGELLVTFLQRVQRVVVQIGRAFVGESGHRLVRRTTAVFDGLGRVPGPRAFEVVIGQFGQQLVVGAGFVLQCRGDALVQPHAPHGRQLGEQRLPDDRVVEPVSPAGLFDDDAGLARLVERVDEVLADHPLDELQREPAADDGRRGQALVRFRRQPGKPAAHGFPNPLRQRARIPHAATFLDMTQRLDEEERITTGDRCQCASQHFVVVTGLGHVRRHVALVQSAECDPVGGAVAVQVGQHRCQRVGAVEVGAAIRADNLHAGVLAETQQMAQQQQRGFGCPVQVVEDQDDGCVRGGHSQQCDDGVEERIALGVGVRAGRRGDVGYDVRQPGNQRK